jgi:hypothetical protein
MEKAMITRLHAIIISMIPISLRGEDASRANQQAGSILPNSMFNSILPQNLQAWPLALLASTSSR